MMRNLNVLLVIAIALFVFSGNAYASVVFTDSFEYVADRSNVNTPSIFVSRGWSHAKSQQTAPGARGYLYTTTAVPGFTGRFPGANSSRVLAIEALPGTLQGQTDFYLQLGHGSSAAYDDYIPGDVWFQFWVYPQNYGSQLSRYGTRNKFLYVCNTDYPCNSHLWLASQGPLTYNPNNAAPLGDPSRGEFFWNISAASGVSSIANTSNPDAPGTVGPTNTSEWMRPNRWTLVKMHVNTSAATGNSWEVWVRPFGGQWTKVSEWIGGRTPGFTWNIPSASVGGHRVLRIPTTVGTPTTQWYDYWMYMDDFVIATTEQDLPAYTDGGVRVPQPPTEVVVE